LKIEQDFLSFAAYSKTRPGIANFRFYFMGGWLIAIVCLPCRPAELVTNSNDVEETRA